MQRARATISAFLDYQHRHHDQDVRAGQKAYQSGMSVKAASEHLEVVEDGVIAECQAAAKRYDAVFETEISSNRESIRSDRQRLEEGLLAQENGLRARHHDELTNLANEWGVESPRQKSLRDAIKQLQQRENFVIGEVHGRPPRYGNLWVYAFIMALLTTLEVPVNSAAFVLFFRETPLISTLLALLCGVMLMYLAHSTGAILRQFDYNRQKHSAWAPMVSLGIILTIALGLMIGLALLRQGYVDFIIQRRAGPSFEQMLEQGQYQAAIFSVAANGLRTDGWIFLGVNMTMFVVGAVASFFKHDPHPDYEKIDRGLKWSRTNLNEIQRSHAQKESRLVASFQDAHHGVLVNIQNAEAHLSQQETKLAAAESERKADLQMVHMVMRQRVLAYRQGFLGLAAADGLDGVITRPIPGLDENFALPASPQIPHSGGTN